MRDLRCPTILGESLIEDAEYWNNALSVVYDRFHHAFEACPDYVEPTVLERYGDPVAKHEALIEAGLAARLP